MAVVLGPDLDLFLRGIGEDLKGKTQLDEPYVDKQTIIRAVREQNNVILTLQDRILHMVEVEKGMQRAIDILEEKVMHFETYITKVDRIEEVLAEKIPLVDKMNEVVQDHDVKIDVMGTKLDEQTNALSSFRSETRGAINEANRRLGKIDVAIEEMPRTIKISSRQVRHYIGGGDIRNNSEDDNDVDAEILEDIISQQEQRDFLQDENITRVEDKVNDNAVQQSERTAKIEKEVNVLSAWKESQSNVDLVTMRENQDSMQENLHTLEDDLTKKMTHEEVEAKLQSQFNQLVDHLQDALTSVESDEAEFKTITDSLSRMCESLREKKADKSEIVSLRKHFIDNQVNINGEGSYGIPLGSSTMDNDELRRILAEYTTKHVVEEMIKARIREGTMGGGVGDSSVEELESKIEAMQKVIDKCLSMMKTGTRKKESRVHESLVASTASGGGGNLQKHTSGEFQLTLSNSTTVRDSITNESSQETRIKQDSSNKNDKTPVPTLSPSPAPVDINRHLRLNPQPPKDNDTKFPSSNAMADSLGDIGSENDTIPYSYVGRAKRSFLQTQPIRPKSAQGPHDVLNKPTKVKKKHSLPAILTTISKTVRPRSKRVVASKAPTIHKGSYQVVTDHNQNSAPTTTTKEEKRFSIPFSRINYNDKGKHESSTRDKRESVSIRTSIA